MWPHEKLHWRMVPIENRQPHRGRATTVWHDSSDRRWQQQKCIIFIVSLYLCHLIFFINPVIIPLLIENSNQTLITSNFFFSGLPLYCRAILLSTFIILVLIYFYGPRETQSQSMWQTHLNFHKYVTCIINFW